MEGVLRFLGRIGGPGLEESEHPSKLDMFY